MTLIDEYVKIQVYGKTMTEGRSEHFKVTKNKIGLNPGIAGGWIRNFKAAEVPIGHQWFLLLLSPLFSPQFN